MRVESSRSFFHFCDWLIGKNFTLSLDKERTVVLFSSGGTDSGPLTEKTMGKGEETRNAILDQALAMTSELGIEAVTIGELAKATGMSKSGLYAHFDSKENLQIAILETASERFIETVVRPALSAPRGIPRLWAIFNAWLDWQTGDDMPGGCVFIAVSSELDDRPGSVRDYLVGEQNRLMSTLARAARVAVEVGHFRADLDLEQFAYDAYSRILGFHFYHRLLKDPGAFDKVRRSFEQLLDSSRPSQDSGPPQDSGSLQDSGPPQDSGRPPQDNGRPPQGVVA